MSEKIEMNEKGYKEPVYDSKDLGEYIQVRLIIPNYKYDSRTCCKLKGTKCPNATIYLDFQSERSFKLRIDPYHEASSPIQDKYQLQIHQLYDNIIPDLNLIDKEQDGLIILRLKKVNDKQSWNESLRDGLETLDPDLMQELK